MAYGTVQFRGKEAVMNAFNDRAVEVWSIWQGKQFINKGKGSEDLQTFIDALMNGGSNAVYTLKVYEDFDDPARIKSITPDDGSFNFKFNGENQMTLGDFGQQRVSFWQGIESRLAGIENKLEESVNEPKPTTYDKLLDVANTDAGKMILGAVISSLFPKASQQPMNLGAIGNIPKQASEETDEDIQQSINTLKQYDDNLGFHLKKLASIAISNPKSFQSLISMLDMM